MTIPNPPPRRSALQPQRRTDGVAAGEAAHRPWTRRLSRRLLAVLIVLLAAAGWFGYSLAARPGGLFGNVTALVVPSVSGNSSTAARLRLGTAGFRVDVTQAPSEAVERDRVISQNPAAGGHTAADGVVHLVVSSGPPIIGVIDLRSYSRADAERFLRHADLVEKVVERYDNAPPGTVLQQAPPPGPLAARSVVTLTVSKGLLPATVPSVVSLDVGDATAVLKRAHLRLVIGEKVASDNIPENVIASQFPDAGGSAPSGSAVTVNVSSGPASTTVPEVGGRGVGDAAAMLRSAGLVPQYDYAFEPGNPVGVVINVSPVAGTSVRHGSTVVLTVVVSGIVPDVAGMALDQAKATLQNAGYQPGNVADTQSGTEGTVVSTEPRAGSTLKPGETVLIYFNSGGGAPASTPAPAANPQATP